MARRPAEVNTHAIAVDGTVRYGEGALSSKVKNILILDGHPDAASERFLHALADAYRAGAERGEHAVQMIRIAELEFPLLRSQAEYQQGTPAEAVLRCQDAIEWATHVVILYPLWLGSMPAMLKALLEQVLRPGFAFSAAKLGRWPVKLLRFKSARLIVTMGMPAALYRWYYRAHSVRSLEHSVLRFVGFRRVRSTLIGSVESLADGARSAWLQKVDALGHAGR
jgi:putative NADPH-quinone reductase